MKHEDELKIQGYLDNQLPPAERREIADLISRDSAAHSLYEALAATKTLLVQNEPDYKLAETREFYWSKIEREIQKTAPPRPEPVLRLGLNWQNWWVRLVGAGAAAVLLGTVILSSLRLDTLEPSYDPQEIESPADMSAITFHSESANMTVVWVQPREDTN
jgi:anti-sigma factor RsiW